MQTDAPEMSASAKSRTETESSRLDTAVQKLGDRATEFARLGPAARADLLTSCKPTLVAAAQAWVDAAIEAKGLRPDAPNVAEEWLAGPMATLRNLRLTSKALRDIATEGRPRLDAKRWGTTPEGRTDVEVFPTDALDAALQTGFSSRVRFLPGVTREQALEKQASFYRRKEPEGGVSLILGAGNVASIPPMDAFYKMFTEGNVCLIKMNPVNEYLGPVFEKGLAPLIDKGYLAVVYGGAEAGSHLVQHKGVADVHITGSLHTHDIIVWGATAEERARRKAAHDPILKKPITSELGCVTPVMVVPGTFSASELRFVAENVATMLVNNGSFNCNAASMLVTAKGWPQREAFLTQLKDVLGTIPPRRSYYPGARDRHAAAIAGRDSVQLFGTAESDRIPWTLITGLDASSNDRLFTHENFCPVLSEVALDVTHAAEYLAAVVPFCNDKLWGTLSCMMIIHPSAERDPAVKSALSAALDALKYGAVAINQWAGIVYGTVSPPWGGHPSATLEDAQGGLGWVHNTPMLEGIEKSILRGPLVVKPKPPWFCTHKNSAVVARKLVDFEAEPSWFKVPGIAIAALSG